MSATPVVRRERAADVTGVRRVVAAAFEGPEVPELLDDLRVSVAWLDLSFVAEDEGEVVAHVAYTRGWVDAPRELVEVLVLSPLSVHPERQRTGIGSLLVRETLRRLEARPEPVVFVEGDPAYYSRLGFVAGAGLGFTAPSVRIPEPAFQVTSLPGHHDPALRGALVYPDVWWRHDAVGLRMED